MRHALKLHPDSRCDAVTDISVAVSRGAPRQLALEYVATGTMANVDIPPAFSIISQRPELWRMTCFELFVRGQAGPAYHEFNFSPAIRSAHYVFSDYRSKIEELDGFWCADVLDPTARVELRAPERDQTACRVPVTVFFNIMPHPISAHISPTQIPDLPDDSSWRLGLSAVIQEANGRMSYWALAHPPGKPDFHHPDCFALELPPASPP
jgi:hypothetical protein